MKTGKVACNYAIIRFLPYPETEEFVNVGVVLACPSALPRGFPRSRFRDIMRA